MVLVVLFIGIRACVPTNTRRPYGSRLVTAYCTPQLRKHAAIEGKASACFVK